KGPTEPPAVAYTTRCVNAPGSRRAGRIRDAAQGEREIAGRLKACRWVLLEAAFDDARERRWNRPLGRAEIRWLLVQDRRHRLGRRVAAKRAAARQELVQDGAEGEKIRAMVDVQSADLLGRHVADGAEDYPWLGRQRHRGEHARRPERRSTLNQLRQPEVEDLDAAIPGDEHVLRFEIAMNDSLV